uniref:Kinesin motor domain-containing protein n=1 Tax=Eutreptiella gymnastica TaxID=73025 RepID=A0A7S4G546_9EUGL
MADSPTSPVSRACVSRALFDAPDRDYSTIDSETIKVYLRIRPRTPVEVAVLEPHGQVMNDSATSCELVQSGNCSRYFFDHVFGEHSPQEEVFTTVVQPLVHSLVRGMSSLVFAYGVTNSGKTYTVHGLEGEDNEGILPRIFRSAFTALELLEEPEGKGYEIVDEFGNYDNFEVIQQQYDPQAQYVILFSALEIYNEKLLDLLDGKSKDLKLVEESGEMVVKGVQEMEVKTLDEALQLLRNARSRIQTGQTLCNADSSRSHSVFTISLCKCEGTTGIAQILAKLTVCDLAGSERANRTQNSGTRLKEASNINQSLVVLGRCLEVLRWNQTHSPSQRRVVPYREAKITRLFQPTLSGNGKAVMIVNISPCRKDLDETVHALKYSSVAREVVNIATAASPRTKRKVQLPGTDGGGISTMQQALSEIQNLSMQLSEAKEALSTMEVQVRQDLSKQWATSLKSLQTSMLQHYEEQEECTAQWYARKAELHERRLEDMKQALALKMEENQSKQDCSMADSNDEATETWRKGHVYELERRVSTLNARLGDEAQKYCSVRQEVEELRRIMDLRQREQAHNDAKQIAMLQNSLASTEHMNMLLQCEVDALKAERARWEQTYHEVGRRLKDQPPPENVAGDLKEKELATKDRELRTLKTKVDSLEQALSAEENIQQNQKKTIDSLTTANVHAANTIKSQHQISDAQKSELQHYINAEQKLREELTKVNQNNTVLQGVISNLKEKAEKWEAENLALRRACHAEALTGPRNPMAGSMISIGVDTADFKPATLPQPSYLHQSSLSYPSALEAQLKGTLHTRSPRLMGTQSTLRSTAAVNSASLARSSPRCAPAQGRTASPGPRPGRVVPSDSRSGTPTERGPVARSIERLRRGPTPERSRTPPHGASPRPQAPGRATPEGRRAGTPMDRSCTPPGRCSPSPGPRKSPPRMMPLTSKAGRALQAARSKANEQSGGGTEASRMSIDGADKLAAGVDASKEGRDAKGRTRGSPAKRKPGLASPKAGLPSPKAGFTSPSRRISGHKRSSDQMCMDVDDPERRRKKAGPTRTASRSRDPFKK